MHPKYSQRDLSHPRDNCSKRCMLNLVLFLHNSKDMESVWVPTNSKVENEHEQEKPPALDGCEGRESQCSVGMWLRALDSTPVDVSTPMCI